MSTYQIVGAHFRPPAKAILQVLQGDCTLQLVPEPSNEYDANAIKICVMTTDIPDDPNLEVFLGNYGMDMEDFKKTEQYHLGYIPRVDAVNLAPALNGETVDGRLTFNMKGQPCVIVDLD